MSRTAPSGPRPRPRAYDSVIVEYQTVHRAPRAVFDDLTRAGFEATTTISRKDFGLTWNAAIEAGGVLVSDKVVLNLDVAFTAPQA